MITLTDDKFLLIFDKFYNKTDKNLLRSWLVSDSERFTRVSSGFIERVPHDFNCVLCGYK